MSKSIYTQSYSAGEHPDLLPPLAARGIIYWMRKNLFSSFSNSILTLLAIALLVYTMPPLLNWGVFTASWGGDDPKLCKTEGVGACWTFVNARFEQFIYGFYPHAEKWRVNILFVLFFVLIAYLVIPNLPKKGLIGGFTVIALPIIAFFLLSGGTDNFVHLEAPNYEEGDGAIVRGFTAVGWWFHNAWVPVNDFLLNTLHLNPVATSNWGGLSLTLVISFVGIVASLPLGILLALGRRSDMPIVKSFCVVFIEFWRGIPLITVLFMSSVMFPLFLPEGMSFDKLLRALLGISLFSSAYMAEVVRGGLQAIPRGQVEAAQSLGLKYPRMMIFVVLPQALKIVIPGIVNTFIGLFKDTTLVLIIGLFDFLGIIQAASQDPKWLGYHVEGYVFAALVYFCFCFSMSRYSMYLENKLHTGHKR